MDTHDKQITIAVPEDRVPEFYAFFAASSPRRSSAGAVAEDADAARAGTDTAATAGAVTPTRKAA